MPVGEKDLWGVNMKNRISQEETKKRITSILVQHGAKRISIFGSYARGEARPGSDIDIMVEFSGRKSLLDIIGIEQELSEAVGMKVDLLTEKSVSPYLIDKIKKGMVVIYG
jgi:predicted nucleotidyltransferase